MPWNKTEAALDKQRKTSSATQVLPGRRDARGPAQVQHVIKTYDMIQHDVNKYDKQTMINLNNYKHTASRRCSR